MLEENTPGEMSAEDPAKTTVRVLIMGRKDKVQELLYENYFLNSQYSSLPSNIREGILNGVKTYEFYKEKSHLTPGTLAQVKHITEILNHVAAQRFPAFEEEFMDAEPVPFVFTDYIEDNTLKAFRIPEKVLDRRGYPESTRIILRQLFVITYRFPYAEGDIQKIQFPSD